MNKIQDSRETLIFPPELRSREYDSHRRKRLVLFSEINPLVAFKDLTPEIVNCCTQMFPVPDSQKVFGKLMDDVVIHISKIELREISPESKDIRSSSV